MSATIQTKKLDSVTVLKDLTWTSKVGMSPEGVEGCVGDMTF